MMQNLPKNVQRSVGIGSLVLSGLDEDELQVVINCLKGVYVQLSANYFHPIQKLNEQEIRFLKNVNDDFSDFNKSSLEQAGENNGI